MIRHQAIEPRFVKTVPRQLEPGVLYVSVEYGTVVHACYCGCGQEVVTPLTPTDWRMTYDGETVSLWPSVGNWNLPCRSHYVIDRNLVVEQGAWSQARIEAEYRRDKAAKWSFYIAQERPSDAPLQICPTPDVSPKSRIEQRPFWLFLARLWSVWRKP